MPFWSIGMQHDETNEGTSKSFIMFYEKYYWKTNRNEKILIQNIFQKKGQTYVKVGRHHAQAIAELKCKIHRFTFNKYSNAHVKHLLKVPLLIYFDFFTKIENAELKNGVL